MGDSAVSVTKITRRKVLSVANDGDYEPGTHRYQIYRGLSPDTSNRLEIKIQSLEEELQAERQARIAAQQQCSYLTEEIQLQNEQYDGIEGRILGHTGAMKAKDQETMKLKLELESLVEKSETNELNMKKKQQEVVNELNEQLEHLTKQRNRSDADKKNFLVELGELSSNLEKIQAAKSHVESKLETCENELRKFHMENEDKTRLMQDFSSVRGKLVHDNGELQSRVKALESAVDGFSRDKQKYLRDIETLKATLEETEAEQPHLISTANGLQAELEECRSSLEDEQQRHEHVQGQLHKVQNELNSIKIKYEKDLTVSNEENDALRRKCLGRVAELEDALTQSRKKGSKFEKDHAKLVVEIREIVEELEMNKANSVDLSKKLKQSETQNSEHRYQVDQLTASLQVAEGNLPKLQAEITRLKAGLTEKDDRSDTLTKELKFANDKAKEYKELGDESRLQVQELLNVKVCFDRDITKLTSALNDRDKKLAELYRSLELAASEVKQLRDELNAEIRMKDEEIINIKKTNQRLVDEHQNHFLEIETRHKNEITRAKKLFETEFLQISANQDSATKASAELSRANKSLANRVKELEGALLNEERQKEDLRSQMNSSERRRTTTQVEFDQLVSKFNATEHGRKLAELALHELEQRVSEFSLAISTAINEARRNESEANSLRGALEEANFARRDAEERGEKFRLELAGASEALSLQLEIAREKDSCIQQLEKDLRGARAALDEVEQKTLREGKKLLAKVQARCKGLEIDLDGEQRKSRESMAENKKLQRLLQEINLAKDNETREMAERASHLESALANIARLKKHLVEAEEVITIVTSKYRKLQHQLQEVSEREEQQEALVLTERSAPLITGSLSHHHHHHSLPLPGSNGVATRISIARSVTSSSSVANRLQ